MNYEDCNPSTLAAFGGVFIKIVWLAVFGSLLWTNGAFIIIEIDIARPVSFVGDNSSYRPTWLDSQFSWRHKVFPLTSLVTL